MNEIEVVLQRHEQQIKTLERDMTDIRTGDGSMSCSFRLSEFPVMP